MTESRASGPGRVLRPASCLALLLALVRAGPGAGQESGEAVEEILSYDVRVDVDHGGVMRVEESIRVRALGEEIRRGIYRDVPTRFPRGGGPGTVVAPFRVLSVHRDGRPEPWELFSVEGPEGRSGVRIRIGRSDVFIPEGVHEYRIVYETERWVRFGEERDSLTWNVTGNGWAFPIRSASAVVSVPGSPPEGRINLDAWTGPTGSRARNAAARWDAGAGAARFRTTAGLDAREGLTVRVGLPSGVIEAPTDAQKSRWFWLDWGGFVDAGLVVVLVLAVYLLMWLRVGRDPEAGTIVVRYEPPEEFSAAALGFVRERGFDPVHLTAALVSLGVKGAVTIERDDDEWTIRPRGGGEGEPPGPEPAELSADEDVLREALVGSGAALTLDGSPSQRLRKGVKKLEKRLERDLEKRYFVNNRWWFALGLFVSLVGVAALGWRYRFSMPAESLFLGVWLAFWTLGVGTLLYRVGRKWRLAFTGGFTNVPGALFLTLFAVPFVAAEIIVGALLYQRAPGHILAAVVVLGGINVLFYHLLERPTLKGRGVLDRLEGFRRFLGATEEDRMDRLQRPDRTLELFERYLPYAIALGVENEWASRFEDALEAAGERPTEGGYAPGWYAGAAGAASPGAMTSALGGSLTSSLSSSSAAPSGGGGGGGGFSGGGGGGGGGGGW